MTAGGHGFDGVERRGLMFVLSSPSGAGKTTLSRLLIERMPGLRMSVSATTRPMRPGEVEGHDYLFVDQSKFEAMVKRNELLEWATVFENRYGTPRAPVEAAAYFICAESLTNATKHGQAHTVQISAAQDEGMLRLAIQDDGVGGAVAGERGGLRGLIDRAEALGGTLEIHSPRGNGTRLAAAVPFEPTPLPRGATVLLGPIPGVTRT